MKKTKKPRLCGKNSMEQGIFFGRERGGSSSVRTVKTYCLKKPMESPEFDEAFDAIRDIIPARDNRQLDIINIEDILLCLFDGE